MSLPSFSTQSELFSTAGLSGNLFAADDRYRLFAQKVFPVLVAARAKLESCYCADNGRVAVEPVLLLGVSLLQYPEALPDRQAVEMLQYHAGWNFALNRQLGDPVCHPTTLVNFRQRLLAGDLSTLRNFITGIATHPARESDEQGALKMAAEQQALGLEKPPVEYVDAAYISAQKLVEAAAEGRELIGPAPSPANNHGRFTSEAFAVAVEQRQARCPAGHQNSQCSRLEAVATGQVAYRFEWDTATCAACPLRPQCIAPVHPHRTLVVGEHHTLLQGRRQEQKTDEFKARMKHRNAIEGTQSELVRAHGLRRARYRGLAKARLQNYLGAAACNLKRWLRRLAWEMQPPRLAAVN
jgi:hypothetical protein